MPEALVSAAMSLYEEVKTRVMVDSEWSREFFIKVGIHNGSVLSPFIFAAFDFITRLARECAIIEMLYASDLVFISETIE